MCILPMRDKADLPDESKAKNPRKKTAGQFELEFIPHAQMNMLKCLIA